MQTIFFETKPWEEKTIKTQLKNAELIKKPLTPKNAKKYSNAEIISTFIESEINKETLNQLPKLKLITTRSTGYDHIDVEECGKRGITVCNVPDYGTHTVAEHTFALLLTITRRMRKALEKQEKDDHTIKGLKGVELCNKTLGVIGTGRIGSQVVKIGQAFGMKIIAHDPFPNKELKIKYTTLTNLLKNSDIITLHAPLTPKTRHLINEENVNKIKKGAIIINTARGGLIQTSALLKGLKNKTISAVGVDVLEAEKELREEHTLLKKENTKWKIIKQNHELLKHPNVIHTPHVAFYTEEALQRIVETTIKNIKQWKKNKPINTIKN